MVVLLSACACVSCSWARVMVLGDPICDREREGACAFLISESIVLLSASSTPDALGCLLQVLLQIAFCSAHVSKMGPGHPPPQLPPLTYLCSLQGPFSMRFWTSIPGGGG